MFNFLEREKLSIAFARNKVYEGFAGFPVNFYVNVDKIFRPKSMGASLLVFSTYGGRETFVRWTHFIHNKINELLEKPKVSLNQFYVDYYEQYKPKIQKQAEYYRWREKAIYGVITGLLIGSVYYLYDK